MTVFLSSSKPSSHHYSHIIPSVRLSCNTFSMFSNTHAFWTSWNWVYKFWLSSADLIGFIKCSFFAADSGAEQKFAALHSSILPSLSSFSPTPLPSIPPSILHKTLRQKNFCARLCCPIPNNKKYIQKCKN